MSTVQRKAEHIRICLESDVQFRSQSSGFDSYRFTHSCLPELDYQEIDLTAKLLGKQLGAPILISSMTGGTAQAREINHRLAAVAQTYQLAMGVGSQRAAIERPDVADTFQVRQIAPDILLLANLGAVQLNYQYGIEQCQRAVDLLEADALILHLNPLQECIQPHGDTNFKGLLDRIATICDRLHVPVIVKEVGNGISAPMAQQLTPQESAASMLLGLGGLPGRKSRANALRQPYSGGWVKLLPTGAFRLRPVLPPSMRSPQIYQRSPQADCGTGWILPRRLLWEPMWGDWLCHFCKLRISLRRLWMSWHKF
jgi:isopentenyl-diphosphate Delta-isomerase